MTDMQEKWSEEISRLYQEIAPVAVPARADQIAALLMLLPFNRDDSFHVVEVGCGEGMLSSALLSCFPKARVTALDGSAEMRFQTAGRLAGYASQVQIGPFELASSTWHTHLHNADCVLSSLAIHHLSNQAKRELFVAIYTNLSARGVLLIADLIEPQRPEAKALFAATWDQITEHQSIAQTGSTVLFDKFKQVEWNYYRYYDPFDKPSPLFDQLLWLNEAGFAVVDCFWMLAGHAVYGGYKTTSTSVNKNSLSFEIALKAAQAALHNA